MNKMSVPSIPSRFMNPVIEQTDGGDDTCKISKLVDDPGKVGPGSYEVLDDPRR